LVVNTENCIFEENLKFNMMIKTIRRNWKGIKKAMLDSQNTIYNWVDYSRKIKNGLSNSVLKTQGCGTYIFFVEKMPEYSRVSDEYLKAVGYLSNEQITFITENREFLKKII